MKKQEAARLDYIDNLRWTMILQVVGLHAAVTYSHIGSWYYNAPQEPGPLTTLFFLVFEVHLQGFFMGFMFLLAGYFVPGAYDRKGFGKFLLDRFLRLGVPSLAYMLLIHPLTGYFLLHWWKVDLPTAYVDFISSGRWLSASGPMWFAVALLIFSAIYALIRRFSGPPATAAVGRVGLGALTCLGLAIAVIAYGVRAIWPIGTSFLNMQFCYFTQYVVLFTVGILASRRAWFQTLPRALGMRLFWGALASPIFAAVLLASLSNPMAVVQTIVGNGTWQSALFALWESLYCVAMCTGLLVLFRERGTITNIWSDRFTRASFGVYMMHMPVLVAVALGLEAVVMPSFGKFLIAWPVALVLTFVLVQLLLRVPVVRRFI